MRELDLCVTSAGAVRIVKRHVVRLGLDISHFTGQRRWSDAQLRRAIASAYSWRELFMDLGLTPDSGDGLAMVKAHAVRLGLDLSRLQTPDAAEVSTELKPDVKRLRDSGTVIAAMWFMMCGCNASIPVEPTHYDLLASLPDGVKRVQVKTTTHNSKDGWLVSVGRRPYSAGNRERKIPYDPDALDYFFILDGDLTMYLIPSRLLAGRVSILLRNYSQYAVGNLGSIMQCSAPAA